MKVYYSNYDTSILLFMDLLLTLFYIVSANIRDSCTNHAIKTPPFLYFPIFSSHVVYTSQWSFQANHNMSL